MKKTGKKITAVLLAMVMVCTMASCGKDSGNEEKTEENKKEFVWVPEFYALEGDNSFYNSAVKDGYIYYEDYKWDEDTQTGKTSIQSISLRDGSAGPSVSFAPSDADNGENEENNNRSMNIFALAEDGLLTVETIYHWEEEQGDSNVEYYLCKYDENGNCIFEKDFSKLMQQDENNAWVSGMRTDGQERIYIFSDSVIFLFSEEGEYYGTITLAGESWITSMGSGKDGKMYISYYDRTVMGTVLREVDFEGKTLGKTYENFGNNYSNAGLIPGMNKDFLLSDNSLWDYELESQSKEEILNWLDCDINSSNISAVSVLEDGRIACISNDWQNDTTELAVLTKKPASEVKEKTEIVIAGLYSDSALQNAAVSFNKSNDAYHVSIKEYYNDDEITEEKTYEVVRQEAMNRLNNDITSDNCPDMLMLSNIDVERFAAKGVFEDLNTWLDNSTVLDKSDYFESILQANTYDGILVSVPKTFSLQTLIGKAADLGKEPGWTVEEMISYGKSHPEAELLSGLTKDNAIEIMLQNNQGNYVNWENGQCSFNNDSFISLLEFAKQFPDEYEYKEDEPSEPTKIGNGQLLLYSEYLYDFESLQMSEAMFEQEVCYIGYPNENRNSGTYLNVASSLSMMAKSDCKDGAWAFLESYLSSGKDQYGFGFPARKSEFAKEKEEALKVEYLTDENGEIMKDENGEPIAQGMGSIGYEDGWMYTYHTPTKEEADKLEELINIATPAGAADETVLSIVKEEAGAFFKGQRSAQDVATVIESRVQVYVNENR